MIQLVPQEPPLQGWDTEIHCDAEGCRKSIRFFGRANQWVAMRSLRKRGGWTTRPNAEAVWKHFCPDHQVAQIL